MYKKTISYTDYNGTDRTEDFYFNFTKAELAEMELSVSGGMQAMLTKIINAQDTPKLADLFKQIIFKAYGEKSADGKRFIKSEELSREFSQTEAYSILYMEMATDDKAAAEFINGVIPADLQSELDEDAVANLRANITG